VPNNTARLRQNAAELILWARLMAGANCSSSQSSRLTHIFIGIFPDLIYDAGNDFVSTICCWLSRGKMDQRRPLRRNCRALPSRKYPHSRHNVTLFTLRHRACGIRLGLTEHHKLVCLTQAACEHRKYRRRASCLLALPKDKRDYNKFGNSGETCLVTRRSLLRKRVDAPGRARLR